MRKDSLPGEKRFWLSASSKYDALARLHRVIAHVTEAGCHAVADADREIVRQPTAEVHEVVARERFAQESALRRRPGALQPAHVINDREILFQCPTLGDSARIPEVAHLSNRVAVHRRAPICFQKQRDRIDHIVVGLGEARVHVQRGAVAPQRDDARAILLEANTSDTARCGAA